MSIDISDKNIRNREKNFLPPAFSKNGHERAGSHPGELFSRTGRTYYGFQILIRSKEEKEEDDDDDDDEDDDVPSSFFLSIKKASPTKGSPFPSEHPARGIR